MCYWTGMQLEDTQMMILMGVNLMVNTAMKLMRGRSNMTVPLTIRDVAQEEADGEPGGQDGRRPMRVDVLREAVFRRYFWPVWFCASKYDIAF
jgi:hypothetical protein